MSVNNNNKFQRKNSESELTTSLHRLQAGNELEDSENGQGCFRVVLRNSFTGWFLIGC